MKKERNKDAFVQRPEYPGGKKAMDSFIKKHLKYPKAALENKIEGTVYIQFKVEFNGKVTKTKIIKSLGFGCDEEAIRLVQLLQFSAPKNKGSRVSIERKLQIHYRLPKPKQAAMQVRYNYVQKEQSKKAYSYTVEL